MQSILLGHRKELWDSGNRNFVGLVARTEGKNNVSKDEVSCTVGRCMEFTAKIRGILVKLKLALKRV